MDPITGLLVFGAGALAGGTLRQNDVHNAYQQGRIDASWEMDTQIRLLQSHIQRLQGQIREVESHQLEKVLDSLPDKFVAALKKARTDGQMQSALPYAPDWTEPANGAGNGQHPE